MKKNTKKVWIHVSYNRYPGSFGPNNGPYCDPETGRLWEGTHAEARKLIAELESGPNILRHGEYASPDYKVRYDWPLYVLLLRGGIDAI